MLTIWVGFLDIFCLFWGSDVGADFGTDFRELALAEGWHGGALLEAAGGGGPPPLVRILYG